MEEKAASESTVTDTQFIVNLIGNQITAFKRKIQINYFWTMNDLESDKLTYRFKQFATEQFSTKIRYEIIHTTRKFTATMKMQKMLI